MKSATLKYSSRLAELTDCLCTMLSSDLSWLLTESLSSSSELDEFSTAAPGRFMGSGIGMSGRVLESKRSNLLNTYMYV